MPVEQDDKRRQRNAVWTRIFRIPDENIRKSVELLLTFLLDFTEYEGWFSRHDCLSAVLWDCILRARLSSEQKFEESICILPVNLRPRADPFSYHYFGNLCVDTFFSIVILS